MQVWDVNLQYHMGRGLRSLQSPSSLTQKERLGGIVNNLSQQKLVWVDTDITIGTKRDLFSYCDVDDGYAIAALLRAEQVEVIGISSTLGNTDSIEVSTAIAKNFISRFGPNSVPVFQGSPARLPENLADVSGNDGVNGLAEVLKTNRITILGIGAATNIAILLLQFPEVIENIDEIVLVAGRRSIDSHFYSGHWQPKPFRDLNFEFDPRAFEVILESKVRVTLVPFEACSHVWIKPHDLVHLEKANSVGRFLASHSLGWMAEWEAVFGANGFNPFDMVAAGYVINPSFFTTESWKAVIEEGPDDTQPHTIKKYLVCNEQNTQGQTVNFCTAAVPECKTFLLERICTHDMAAFVLGTSHVNVIVPAIDEASQYYQRVLGFVPAYDKDGNKMDYQGVEMKAFAVDAGLPGGTVNVDVCFLRHPQAHIYLELMTYHAPKGNPEIPDQPKTYDIGGPRHIAMEVSNCNEVFNYLSAQEGVTIVNGSENFHPVKLDGFPITFFYWVDRYGIQWEMEEGRRVGTLRGIV